MKRSNWLGKSAREKSRGLRLRDALYPADKHEAVTLRDISTPHSVRGNESENREQGFTLVELLVVLAILGLLIALVAPAVIRQLGSAKHKIAQQSIERLSGVLDLYRLDVGDYPSTPQGLAALNDNTGNINGWNGPYIKDAGGILDPWGHPFQYRNPSQRPKHAFDILSLGADGKPGGDGEDADILNR